MSPSQIRMLAVDVDGTLTLRGDEISPATRAALHRAWEAGIEVVIATGRRWRSTRRVIAALDLRVRAVVLGGALIKAGDGTTLHSYTFEPEDFQRLRGLAHEAGLAIVCQRDSSVLGGADFVIDGGAHWNSFTAAYFEQNREWAGRGENFAEVGCPDALVLGAFGEEAELRVLDRKVREAHADRFQASIVPGVVNGSAWYLELTPASVSKWSGLCTLAEEANIRTQAICAVGDQMNDLPMIRGAGMGVAMGNAHAEVKAAADWTTGRCDEDGVAAVVEHLLG